MIKICVTVLVLLLVSVGFLSCSDNKRMESDKGAIEKLSDETSKKISDRMLESVKKAREVTDTEQDRLDNLDHTLNQ